MTTETYANNYQTTLASNGGSISSGATTINILSGTGAPSGQSRFRVDSELIIGSVSGTVLTATTRGAEGTTAASHLDGTIIINVLTAASLLDSPGLMTTTGDMEYMSSTGPARLPVGVSGAGLQTSAGGIPVWVPGAMVNPMSQAGDIIFGSGGIVGGPDLAHALGTATLYKGDGTLVGGAALAIDANDATGVNVPHNGADAEGWIIVDLGTPTAIRGMRALYDNDMAQNHGCALYSSPDASTWTTQITDTGHGHTPYDTGVLTSFMSGTTTARYWRLKGTGGTDGNIYSFELYAPSATGVPARLEVGAAGTILASVSGAPAWTSQITFGSGAPSGGSDGQYYFRTDTPGTSNQRLYVHTGGSWTGIL